MDIRNSSLELKGIKTVCGQSYHMCKATVTIGVTGSDGVEEDLTVVYPLQDENHLIMLMKNADTGKDINHFDKLPIYKLINNALGGKE